MVSPIGRPSGLVDHTIREKGDLDASQRLHLRFDEPCKVAGVAVGRFELSGKSLDAGIDEADRTLESPVYLGLRNARRWQFLAIDGREQLQAGPFFIE